MLMNIVIEGPEGQEEMLRAINTANSKAVTPVPGKMMLLKDVLFAAKKKFLFARQKKFIASSVYISMKCIRTVFLNLDKCPINKVLGQQDAS
uniref:Uncharacterized protein n=1 Tax=Romanomermis culicivorax TaxID=13658 RepID=A0A915K4M6_ROMCU